MRRFLERIGFDRSQASTYAVLLSAPLLLSIYRYEGSAERFSRYLPSLATHPLSSLFAVFFSWAAFFLLVMAVPLLFARLVMRLTSRDLGLRAGDVRAGLLAVAVMLPALALPIAFLSSRQPGLESVYPLGRVLFERHDLVLWYELAYVLVYYLAWEFFFRGFLLFPLARAFGGVNAILIQTVSSCLVHIGKPENEVFGSILAGLILGALALRTGSILYGWILHASLGALLDLFIIFRQ